MQRFTEALARKLETAGSSVMAFAMNPGFVRSEMTENLLKTPTGLKWQTYVKEMIERGVGFQPGDCARAKLELLRIAGPELNGCSFGVETDFEAVEKQKADVRAKELYLLRLKT